MKILVDIGHPAHVHVFKNFIWNMEGKGNEILITARDKDVALQLLNAYGFEYKNVGKYGKSLFLKMMDLPKIDYNMYKIARKFKPDILTGFGSVNAAHVSALLRKPCILFTDTEHCPEQQILYRPFISAICTPSCFKKDLGKKQLRFNGYKELAYLHPNYFKPNPEVLDELNLSKDDKFIIMRFISWEATHDVGLKGIEKGTELEIIKTLEQYGKVFITSERKLDKNLEKYKIPVSPDKLLSLLYFASLYIGEGGTTAVEAAILGTPSIHIEYGDPNKPSAASIFSGNFLELRDKYDLVYMFPDQNEALKKAIEILENENSKKEWQKKREKLLNDKIDVTKFMVEFIENYPESFYEYQKTKKDGCK
ncbi:MAG: hypothetical protein COZ53_01145 [Candidatus Altarchaeum sp. CG_4_8_14_3_um_filter_33_2054]|nr:MAG: hypothetical protein COZ53_01145 [Candidatus Altarchaeum sp. CG_4_8_14_3_um_filter_33_2054]PIZ29344.1 MAG: hypothetical protein COY41_05760 [Candidatus Altarchaeum sp. CG_4_10_14_0_8_um_filter_32_851]